MALPRHCRQASSRQLEQCPLPRILDRTSKGRVLGRERKVSLLPLSTPSGLLTLPLAAAEYLKTGRSPGWLPETGSSEHAPLTCKSERAPMGGESPEPAVIPTGAVFLSHASHDADAARRICDALRAAGIEVWFDKNALRGGDAWDRMIRGQATGHASTSAISPRSRPAVAESP